MTSPIPHVKPRSGVTAAVVERTPDRDLPLGLIAFLGTVVMLFTAFTASYLIRRTGTDFERVPLPGVLWASTAILAASSASLEAARRGGRRRWIAATIGLGVAFLAGQVLGWRALAAAGVYLPTNPHASYVYVLTAIHALHLAGGLVALGAAWSGRLGVRPAAFYWHFMGAMWIYVALVLSIL